MGLFSLEHSKLAYCADSASYVVAVVVMTLWLLVAGPQGQELTLGACALLVFFAWRLIEYLLHHFVLHDSQPSFGWHEAHHDRPTALIWTPTVLSAGLMVLLVYLPALLLAGSWNANALTLGVLAGYMTYTGTHHLTRHGRARNAWLARRKQRHATDHHLRGPVCVGMTSGLWARVFRSTSEPSGRRKDLR